MTTPAEVDGAPPVSAPESPDGVANGTSVDDGRFRVSWDSDTDPANPMNWTPLKRWSHIFYISLLTFLVSLVSSMLAPAVPDVMVSLGSDDSSLASFVVSVYVIGFAVGPLLAAPVSELYGRAIVYHLSNVLLLGCTVGCALSVNVGMFIAFRFLSGLVGVAPLSLGGSSIGDVMPPESVAKAMAIWGLGSLVGPIFAPIAGGYVSQNADSSTLSADTSLIYYFMDRWVPY
ncbi:hypothetical protein VTI74DRAFT_3404 [Chaetomium olivicolor]